jgi:hypothetical protein
VPHRGQAPAQVEEEAPASLVGGYGSDEDEDEGEGASGLPAGFFDGGEDRPAKRAKTGTTGEGQEGRDAQGICG